MVNMFQELRGMRKLCRLNDAVSSNVPFLILIFYLSIYCFYHQKIIDNAKSE